MLEFIAVQFNRLKACLDDSSSPFESQKTSNVVDTTARTINLQLSARQSNDGDPPSGRTQPPLSVRQTTPTQVTVRGAEGHVINITFPSLDGVERIIDETQLIPQTPR